MPSKWVRLAPFGSTFKPNLTFVSTPHHIPDVVSDPIHDWVHACDKLEVFGFGGFLIDQKHDKTGRHERHGGDDEDRDEYVRAFQTEIEINE